MEKRILKRADSSTAIPKEPAKTSGNPLITEEFVEHLNYRIQQEEMSSRLYLSMSLWLNNEGYLGAGALWKKYSQEELAHADWARTYLLSFGIQPITPLLEEPQQVFEDLPEIIRASFDHEINISQQIKVMASKAMANADHMLYELCMGYLKEQVEEHDKMQTWIDRLSAFGEDRIALRFLDNEMANA